MKLNEKTVAECTVDELIQELSERLPAMVICYRTPDDGGDGMDAGCAVSHMFADAVDVIGLSTILHHRALAVVSEAAYEASTPDDNEVDDDDDGA